ncbi:MAG: NAD(P)-dependent glycerol-3-phosphate dehydrogenase [Desulfovibrionaceae bacterium]|nr:NAD(P)-dependent glycerol-3-phosphate dehydrogenase [Desulfovibrionaceae bacterium]
MKQMITVLGGGSWGTALAHLVASAGHSVFIAMRNTVLASTIVAAHENTRYLPGIPLHPSVKAGTDNFSGNAGQILASSDLVILSIPCQSMRMYLRRIRPYLRPDCILVNASKGIEVTELVTVEQMVREELPEWVDRYAVLSGPSFAREVALSKPTAVVLGCRDEDLGKHLREIFATDWFRSYSSTDVTGVELGGAVKNIIAIGAGLCDGLGFGHNARAALVTRGLVEISRLGMALGASPKTFMGLSGLGDLMLTCSGDLSRNRQVGLRLGKGEKLDDIAASMNMVAEGVKTVQAVHSLAEQLHVEMPVSETVYAVLYENMPPDKCLRRLMGRTLREE